MMIDTETTDTALVDLPSASYSYAIPSTCCDVCGATVKGFNANTFILCESCDIRLNARNYDNFGIDLDYEYVVDDIDSGDWYW